MKQLTGSYEHHKLGFPKIKLKWFWEHGKITSKYITVDGVIEHWSWSNESEKFFDANPNLELELRRFDDYVLKVYSHRTDLQG